MSLRKIRKNKDNTQKSNLPTIILMSRWHAINRCKSRLAKEIGSSEAAQIQKKLTQHTIAVANEIQDKGS